MAGPRIDVAGLATIRDSRVVVAELATIRDPAIWQHPQPCNSLAATRSCCWRFCKTRRPPAASPHRFNNRWHPVSSGCSRIGNNSGSLSSCKSLPSNSCFKLQQLGFSLQNRRFLATFAHLPVRRAHPFRLFSRFFTDFLHKFRFICVACS